MTSTTAAAPPQDLDHRRLIGAGRVAIALAAIALGSVEALPVPAWSVWVAAVAWLPAATWLWFAEEGPPDRVRTAAGMALDVAVVMGLMLVAPAQAPLALLLAVPLTAATTYSTGIADGLAVVAMVLLGRLVHLATGATAADPVLEAGIGGVAAAVVALMAWAGAVRRRDQAQSAALLETATTIIDRSAEAVVITDSDGTVVRANPTADRVLVDGSGVALVGATCTDRLALHTAAGRPLDCRTGCALAALCTDHDGEVELFRTLGEGRQPLLATATPLRDHRGRTLQLHSFRDVTRLKQADEAKTMFLATASHELKTPLTVIRGFTQLLQRSVADPESKTALDAIEARSTQLAAIVDRLLLSSRIEAGHVQLSVETVDLTRLLRTHVPEMAGADGGRIVVEVPDGLVVRASAAALQTVMEQLVGNALKYSSGPVRVAAAAVDVDVEVVVQDTGIGMTADQVAQCFGRFWQAEASDVRRYGGTGIGLYIVRSLVEAMEGRVTVESAIGAGSTFRVTLGTPRPEREAALPAARDDLHRADDQRTAAAVTVDEFMTQLGLGAAEPRSPGGRS